MLAPVIGIVEVGLQGHADRYTYLPQIGLCIALVWAVSEFTKSLPRREVGLGVVGTILIVALSACTWKQTTFWRNSETLWTHTLAVTKNNDVAHTNYGMLLMGRGELDAALSQFRSALNVHAGRNQGHHRLNPRYNSHWHR